MLKNSRQDIRIDARNFLWRKNILTSDDIARKESNQSPNYLTVMLYTLLHDAGHSNMRICTADASNRRPLGSAVGHGRRPGVGSIGYWQQWLLAGNTVGSTSAAASPRLASPHLTRRIRGRRDGRHPVKSRGQVRHVGWALGRSSLVRLGVIGGVACADDADRAGWGVAKRGGALLL